MSVLKTLLESGADPASFTAVGEPIIYKLIFWEFPLSIINAVFIYGGCSPKMLLSSLPSMKYYLQTEFDGKDSLQIAKSAKSLGIRLAISYYYTIYPKIRLLHLVMKKPSESILCTLPLDILKYILHLVQQNTKKRFGKK